MERIKKVISDTFSIATAEVNEKLVLRDLNTWDSFNHMVFIVAVEQEFSVELTADEIVKMQSFNDIVEVLSSKMQLA